MSTTFTKLASAVAAAFVLAGLNGCATTQGLGNDGLGGVQGTVNEASRTVNTVNGAANSVNRIMNTVDRLNKSIQRMGR